MLLAYLDRAGGKEDAAATKLHAIIAGLQKRLELLEAQPLPARGTLKVMSKSQDYAFAAPAEATASTAERAHELIKIALANPYAL